MIDVDLEAGLHTWVAEGYSALFCLRCYVTRNCGVYYLPDGERYDGTPLCIAVPDVGALIAKANDDNAWRAEGSKL